MPRQDAIVLRGAPQLTSELALSQAILFDYDDTLVATRECKYAAIAALAKRHYGAEIDPVLLDRTWGAPYVELFRTLFEALDSDVERVIRRYEELDQEFPMQLYPDTLPVLAWLLERHPVGIVTAAGREVVERQTRALGIPVQRLAVLQTAEHSQHHKPDPRVFEPALEQLATLGIARNDITYVGDSLRDFEAARGAGFRFVGVLHGTTSAAEFERAGATAVASLDALRALF
jgi:HAD superfamily hydrolase (TIGR01549 family)